MSSRFSYEINKLVEYIPQQAMTNQTHITESNEFLINVEQRVSLFDKIILRETINVKYFKSIMKNKEKYLKKPETWLGVTYNEVKLFEKYNYLLKKNKNKFTEIEWSKRNNKYGRTFSKSNSSIMYFRDTLRHTLCKENYIDIDIDNCHPNILNQLCIINGVRYVNTFLNEYCLNREDKLQEVVEHYKVSRGIAKLLFICLINQGQINNWKKNYDVKVNTDLDFVNNFDKEVKKLGNQFFKECSNILKHIQKIKINDDPFFDKTRTWSGNTMSTLLCYYEDMVLECIFKYLVDERYIINNNCVLAFDGMMIEKKYVKNLPKLLNDICNNINKELGFVITMSNKVMDKDFIEELNELIKKDSDEFKDENDYSNLEERLNKIKKDFIEKYPYEDLGSFNERLYNFINKYMNEYNLTTDYYIKREYFSEWYIYFSETKSFLIKTLDEDTNTFEYNRNNNLNISHLFYTKIVNEEIKDEMFEKMIYCFDKTYPRYTKDLFRPIGIYEKTKKTNYYNLFQGFGYRTNIYKNEIKEEDFKLLNDYLNYILEYICENNLKSFSYLMSLLKHILVKPREKNGVAVVLYSKEKACGKNDVADCLGITFGEYLSKSIKFKEMMNQFTDIDDFLLIFVDEVDKKTMKSSENYSMIKNKITDINGTSTKKFRDTVKSKSYTRFFFLTNELESIRTDSDETRFFYLNVKKETDDDKLQHITKLIRTVKKSKTFNILFGKLLEKCDFEIYKDRTDWAKNIPITKTSNMFKSLTVIEQFLSNFVSNTLNIKNLKTNDYNIDYNEIQKVILNIDENDNITFSLNKLYILFTYFYTGNNTKTSSFCKETFKTNFINIYGSLITYKKDRKLNEETLIINKDDFINKLINLKIIKNDEFDQNFINLYIGNNTISDIETTNKLKKIIKTINRKINDNEKKNETINKKNDVFDKITKSLNEIRTDILLQNDNNSQKIIIEKI
jgi:hypothetical protein